MLLVQVAKGAPLGDAENVVVDKRVGIFKRVAGEVEEEREGGGVCKSGAKVGEKKGFFPSSSCSSALDGLSSVWTEKTDGRK